MTPWTRFVTAFHSTQPVGGVIPATLGQWERSRLATVKSTPRNKTLSAAQLRGMTTEQIYVHFGLPNPEDTVKSRP